jgi:hypothetical protein
MIGPLLVRLVGLRLTFVGNFVFGEAEGESLKFSTGLITKPESPPQIKGKVGLKPTFNKLSRKKRTKLTDRAAAGPTLGLSQVFAG